MERRSQIKHIINKFGWEITISTPEECPDPDPTNHYYYYYYVSVERAQRKTGQRGPESQAIKAERREKVGNNEQNGKSRSRNGAVSGLNLPLMAAQACSYRVVSYHIGVEDVISIIIYFPKNSMTRSAVNQAVTPNVRM